MNVFDEFRESLDQQVFVKKVMKIIKDHYNSPALQEKETILATP